MKAELISFGFLIGGPKSETYVSSREEIEPKISELAAAEGYDTDEYTATEVFAKMWSAVTTEDLLAGSSRDWDKEFKK